MWPQNSAAHKLPGSLLCSDISFVILDTKNTTHTFYGEEKPKTRKTPDENTNRKRKRQKKGKEKKL